MFESDEFGREFICVSNITPIRIDNWYRRFLFEKVEGVRFYSLAASRSHFFLPVQTAFSRNAYTARFHELP